MVTIDEIEGTNILEFAINGKISAEEFDAIVKKAESMISKHGKIRVLEQIIAFGGMPIAKYWEDIRFGFRHLKDVTKAAIVTDKKWIETISKPITGLYPGEVRFFELAELDQARVWLREA
jgi:hypothetical protein